MAQCGADVVNCSAVVQAGVGLCQVVHQQPGLPLVDFNLIPMRLSGDGNVLLQHKQPMRDIENGLMTVIFCLFLIIRHQRTSNTLLSSSSLCWHKWWLQDRQEFSWFPSKKSTTRLVTTFERGTIMITQPWNTDSKVSDSVSWPRHPFPNTCLTSTPSSCFGTQVLKANG